MDDRVTKEVTEVQSNNLPKPQKEIDEPLEKFDYGRSDTLKTQEIKEKDKDRRDKRYFSAFKLIVGCLVFLGLIYIVETVVSVCISKSVSNITDGVIEIVKTLLFTLSGYLFARKENNE